MPWLPVQHLLITSLLAVGVWAICCLLPKHAGVRHALWLVVLCKFLIPPIVFLPW